MGFADQNQRQSNYRNINDYDTIYRNLIKNKQKRTHQVNPFRLSHNLIQ